MIEGYKDSPIGEIPISWIVKELGEIASIKGRIGFRGYTVEDLVDRGNGAFTIGAKHINNNSQLDFSSPVYIKWEKYEESPEIKVSVGDLLMVQRGTLGKVALVKSLSEPATINPSMVLIKELKCSENYLFYYLCSNHVQIIINQISTATAVPMISQKQIKSFKIALPPLQEQQKIAEILSTVDDKIDVIDQQISETQTLKNGLMQRLLTKGIGHSEFKDSPLGKIPKGWEVVNFNSVCSNFSSKFNEETGKCIDLEHIEQSTGRITGFGNIEEKSSIKNVFKIGDVLFCKLRPYLRKYWECMFEGGCTSELMVLRPKNNFLTKYLFYTIQTDSFIENSVSKSYGTKMPRTSWKILSEYELGLPTLIEQKKISSVLSSVDEKLDVLTEKKKYYQELKQGLMQQLLTGKIRVAV